MYLILCEIPVYLLIAGKGKASLLVSSILFLILLSFAIIITAKRKVHIPLEIYFPIISITVSLILAAFFFLRWHTSGRMMAIAEMIGKPLQQTTVLISLLLAFLSLSGVDCLLKCFKILIIGNCEDTHVDLSDKYVVFFIALTAVLTMFLNSRCSPFYPFNDWVDPNTMFTVGKGVLRGYVPYRDLYEQKGPLLVFLHTLGAAISYDTFYGIWFIELVACFVFLYLTYRTLNLFFGRKSICIIPIYAGILYSAYAFRAGDTAEEFALPLLAYAFYVGLRVILQNELPSKKTFFMIGLTSGAVFWLKYSMTGLYLGWILCLIVMAVPRKLFPALVKGGCWILFGIVLSSVPILIYFCANSALDSLFEAYFYNNLAYYYTNDFTLWQKLYISFFSTMGSFRVPMILIGIGLIWLFFRKKYSILCYTLISFITTFFFIFVGGIHGPYYGLPLGVFSVVGFCAVFDTVIRIYSRKSEISSHSLIAPSLLWGLVILCGFSCNLSFLEIKKEDMFQYRMVDIIRSSGIENPSILSYNIGDAGVNTTVGAIPGIRYFCYYNNERMTEIREIQDQCIEDQCVDYIIARTKFDNVYPGFDTYEHREAIVGMADQTLEFFHYYTPKIKER